MVQQIGALAKLKRPIDYVEFLLILCFLLYLYRTMNLRNKNQLILFVLIIGSLVVSSIIAAHHKKDYLKDKLNLSFKGAVRKIYYNVKDIPYITVNGKEYNLIGTIRNLDYKIQKGDTIIKQKGDIRIKIIRPDSRDTIYDRNQKYDPIYKRRIN